MTAKQAYEACLIELNKQGAPSILLEDFNYLFNKAINQYINKKYNVYDVNQETTDSLRVLKSTAMLTPKKSYTDNDPLMQELSGATYEVMLPEDYLHILNCICIFKVVGGNYKCYNDGKYVRFGAKRLTSDMWGQIINNFYLKPSYKQPYYFIHNTNTSEDLPTNPIRYDDSGKYLGGTDYDVNVLPDGETQPETTSYKVIYGVSDVVSNVAKDTNATTLTGNASLTVSTENNTLMVYAKVQNDSGKKVTGIYQVGSGYKSPLQVSMLSDFNTDTYNTTKYETAGYTTYLGYLTGFKSFGAAGQTINIEIG